MTPEIHRTALRAAAKLALSALAIGCSSASTTDATSSSTTTNDLTTRDAGESVPVEVAAYCGDAGPKKSARGCCDAELASAQFPDDGGAPDSLTLGCCDVLIHSADPWSSEQLGACCNALGTPHGPACTPWGPPVPPAMSWRPAAVA